MTNKHGRVGVKATRLTRGDLKKNVQRAADHAHSNGRFEALQEEKEYLESLLHLKNARDLHRSIRERLERPIE